MTRIGLTITFTDEGGTTRSESHSLETSNPSDTEGEQSVSHNLFAELKVDVGEQGPPKYHAITRGWLNFPNRPARITNYFDIRNSQALWFELSNLVLRIEADLNVAQAFKALEPAQEPSFDDHAALNDLHYIHDRKMGLLNQAVYGLIKVQELVNRLLHESMGGDLVDTTQADWEKTQLTRKNVEKGLKAKLAGGAMSQSDFDAVRDALDIPQKHPRAEIALTYRNRLTHHIRPSVDYPMFFSALESRKGQELRMQGKIVGRQHIIRARQSVQYAFRDLYAAFSEYLDATATMLQNLTQIEILRR